MQSNLDTIAGIDDRQYILKNINIKYNEYNFVVQELEELKLAARDILVKLQYN